MCTRLFKYIYCSLITILLLMMTIYFYDSYLSNSNKLKQNDNVFFLNNNDYLNPNNYVNDNTKSNINFVAKSSEDIDISNIAKYYNVDCKNSEDCEKTDIYKFYRKLYDIYFMYKYKYNVSINLAMITTTLNYNSVSQDTVFSQNLNNYNKNKVRENDYNNDNITNLDWETDFKNLSGYKYLNANDFRYDMQILAKNMVTKKITYSCGDETKEAKDIENSNYSEKLKCENGTLDEDSIEATYELDMDKYDEFLLEYVEHKFFLQGYKVEDEGTEDNSSSNNKTSGNSSVVECARGALGVPYVWGGTDYKKGMDCSGLVYVCYQKALGITPPRTTWGLYDSNLFEKVKSVDDLEPGDLIEPHDGHVVIYTGDGTIIEEPHTGAVCTESSVDPYKTGAYAYLHYIGKK